MISIKFVTQKGDPIQSVRGTYKVRSRRGKNLTAGEVMHPFIMRIL